MILILILLNSCSESPEKISKGHLESMSHECEKDTDKKLCINELKTKFFNDGNNYVTFEDLNKSQTRRVKLNCQNYKKRGLLSYNNCLADQKETAISGKLTKKNRDSIPKGNIDELFQSVFYLIVYENEEKLKKGQASAGSGVAVGNNLLASNCHVVGPQNGKNIIVFKLNNKFEKQAQPYSIAKLYKQSNNSDLIDVCLVKTKKKNLKKVRLRKFNKLKNGEYVRAVGNPLGFTGHTSRGEINNLRIGLPQVKGDVKIIVHDAAMGSGSSGGPLFDFKNNLIGLNTWVRKGSKNEAIGGAINIAISSDHIRELLD